MPPPSVLKVNPFESNFYSSEPLKASKLLQKTKAGSLLRPFALSDLMENQSAPRFFIIFFLISVSVRAFLTGVAGKELDHLLGSLSLCLGRLSRGKGHFVLPDVWTPSACRTVDTGDGSVAACLVEGRRIDSGNINTSRFISPLEMREPVNSLCASLRPCVSHTVICPAFTRANPRSGSVVWCPGVFGFSFPL